MNSLDLTKILRVGDVLYSSVVGECKVINIDSNGEWGITVKADSQDAYFTREGKYTLSGECTLFPSKDNRDWSTFKRKDVEEPKEELSYKEIPFSYKEYAENPDSKIVTEDGYEIGEMHFFRDSDWFAATYNDGTINLGIWSMDTGIAGNKALPNLKLRIPVEEIKETFADIVNKTCVPTNSFIIPFSSKEQLLKLSAINKMLIVAKYLNGDWKPDWNNEEEYKYYPIYDVKQDRFLPGAAQLFISSVCYFKSAELAQKAIDILGKEVIKTALGDY